MYDQYYYYGGLKPEQALHTLAEVAEGPGKPYMAGASVYRPRDRMSSVILNWPDLMARCPRSEQKERGAAMNAVRDAYGHALGKAKAHSGVGPLQDSCLPICEGAAWLLGLCKTEDENYPIPKDEVLVVGYDMDLDQADLLSERLRLTTSVRVASARADAGRPCWFFWVKDDRGQESLFSREDIGYPTLDGFACEVDGRERLIFLPEGFVTTESALFSFCRLVQAAPELFGGLAYTTEDNDPLAAIEKVSPEPDATPITYRIWYLADLPFWDRVRFASSAHYNADLQVCQLKGTPNAIAGLVDRIRTDERHRGYRLRLHSLPPDPGDLKVEQLEQQIAEMRDELEYWKTLRKPHPRLLRFTDRQLPALADVMSRYPQDVIRDGRIKYAFQASDNQDYHPEGLHYLLISGDVRGKMIELDPLLLWADPDGPAIQFGLDPAWSREYFDRAPDEKARHWVFVPEGTALFPSMHPWDAEGMDEYLRDCMGAWFHGAFDVAPIPKRPIYVFDGVPDSGAKIHISVLDWDDFVPFEERLEWMNDRLLPVHWKLRTMTIRQETGVAAQNITTEAIADEVVRQANETRKRFQQTVDETRPQLEATTGQLTKQLTEGLRELTDETEKKVKAIAELRKRLQVLQNTLDQMDRALGAAQSAQEEVEASIQRLQAARQKLQGDTEAEISKAQEALREVGKRVRKEINDLVEKHDALKKEIDELLDKLP